MVSRATKSCRRLLFLCGFNALSRKKITYPNLSSAMRPVPHSDKLPVPTSPASKDLLHQMKKCLQENILTSRSLSEDNVSLYSAASDNEPYLITQEDMNDLARDLHLSKQQSELLASQLKQNLVKADIKIISFSTQNKDFASFFNMNNRLCYCTNISGLLAFLGFPQSHRLVSFHRLFQV